MFKTIHIGRARSPVTVVALHTGEEEPPPHVRRLDRAAGGVLAEAMKTPGFKAEAGETVPAGREHLLLGLGKREDLSPQTLRTVGARLVKRLDRMAASGAMLHIAPGIDRRTIKPELAGRCIAEGMALANWRVDFFDGTATKHEQRKGPLAIDAEQAKFNAGLKEGLLLGECANYTRRLAATPPNICNPQWVANEAKKLAREVGLTFREISFAEAKRLGMGGIVNVGKASASKPRLVILEHKPRAGRFPKPRAGAKGRRGKSARTLVLVGKTITFDTGGYSLKTGGSMKGMKYDKNGGMAVLGAMRTIALRNTPAHVVGLLPCAENMVSSDAYRPDDIITMYNGATVEVISTDAEGRLVLADALAYACRKYKPAAIIDAATLTGGVIIALGRHASGLFCNDEPLAGQMIEAGEASGERTWRLPLWKEYQDMMRARHADIWNSAPQREAHPIQGAAFLSFFVDEKIPWAHVDIAGVSAVDSDQDLYVQGPTGYGVRLLAEAVARLA